MSEAPPRRAPLLAPLSRLLRQGLTADELALSLAIGFGVGVFPVLGVSTPLCTLLALLLRLNLPAIQLVNYAAAPAQLLLIIPFVRFGERLCGAAPEPLTVHAAIALLATGVVRAIGILWSAIVHAALGWLVLGPPLIYVLYRALRVPLRRLAATRAARAPRARTAARPPTAPNG